jgi:hypothetical protein
MRSTIGSGSLAVNDDPTFPEDNDVSTESILMLSQESNKIAWQSKKHQIQDAQLSRDKAYSGTPQ